MRKPVKKLYRLTPLNRRINLLRRVIWKIESGLPVDKEATFIDLPENPYDYLKGLVDAKELVQPNKE